MSIPAKSRALVAERSKGACEGCGAFPATEIHHRKYKSRGGSDRLSNLMAVCGFGNHAEAGCHGVAHSGRKGEAFGWAIRSRHDPLLVPKFRTFDSSWWRFDDDGGKEQVHPVDAREYLELIGAIREGVTQ